MTYASQRIAKPYILIALLLFVLQVLMGLYLAFSYFYPVPQEVVNLLPFSTARAMHTNLLVLWLLLGFMGVTYYVVPEETQREIFSPKMAYLQLAILVATGVTALVGFYFGWTQGRPLLEIPRPLDFLVVAGALMFLFNVGATMVLAKRWTVIQGTLLGGMTMLSLLYLFGIPFYKNLSIDWYYWWWVIHLWVEGAWEVITSALMAFILLKISGVDRKIVEKWLYIELGLFLFTGIAGTGHHYYWIGAPHYWFWIGGIFSAMEPLPILFMVIDTFNHVKARKEKLAYPTVWLFAVGCSIYHLIGAGVWGFLHTLPQINRYTHGSQVTVSHGHLAFFGAFALVNLTAFYYVLPKLKGIKALQPHRAKVSFWWLSLAMMGMGLTFGVAGVLQSYLERKLGLGFMLAQDQMRFWMMLTFAFGIIFFFGVLYLIRDLLSLRESAD